MAGIRQFQRRAIEFLWQKLSMEEQNEVKWPEKIKENNRFAYNDQEVYFLGISTGMGSCADIHGMNVAVFGNFGSRPKFSRCKPGQGLQNCSLAVLVRKPKPDEQNEMDISRLMVELLWVTNQKEEDNIVRLATYKDLKIPYCHLI